MQFQLTDEAKLQILQEKLVAWEKESYRFKIDLKVAKKVEDTRMEEIAIENLTRIEAVITELESMIDSLIPVDSPAGEL